MKPSRIKEHVYFEIEEEEAFVSVAMPIYNNDKIAWLAMESLCKQQTSVGWELIICEEKHAKQCGIEYFIEFVEDLKQAGCVSFRYLELDYHVLLVEKWKIIGKNISPSSEAFLLQAGDCYSFSKRIEQTYRRVVVENYDWYDVNKGFFYSFTTDDLMLYDYDGLTNLNMGFKSIYAKRIPESNKKKGIDGLLFNTFKSGKPAHFKKFTDKALYFDSLDTDGFNNISLRRQTFYNDIRPPFVGTTFNIENLPLPERIKRKMNLIRFVK